MPLQDLLELELIVGRDRPNLHCGIRRASGEVSALSQIECSEELENALDIGTEKTACKILGVGLKFCNSLEAG